MNSTKQTTNTSTHDSIWNSNEKYLRDYIRSRAAHQDDTSKILFNVYVETLANPIHENDPGSIRYALKRTAQKEVLRFYTGDEGIEILENMIKGIPENIAA